MSWTPCRRCGEPLVAREGSSCSNPQCRDFRGKPLPEQAARLGKGKVETRSRRVRRAFKGIH